MVESHRPWQKKNLTCYPEIVDHYKVFSQMKTIILFLFINKSIGEGAKESENKFIG